MKTRRIYLNLGESVEIINQYGTSLLKATAKFDYSHPIVVVYEQPDVLALTPEEAKQLDLTPEPSSRTDIFSAINTTTEGDHF